MDFSKAVLSSPDRFWMASSFKPTMVLPVLSGFNSFTNTKIRFRPVEKRKQGY